MVQAYRDTWELGVHSFLTYLRDRLLARELLHPSGSVFVQMSDTNLHHVREVMDEAFGAPAAWVQAGIDLSDVRLAQDLRSTRIFSVHGLRHARIGRMAGGDYRIEFLDLEAFDPVETNSDHRGGGGGGGRTDGMVP